MITKTGTNVIDLIDFHIFSNFKVRRTICATSHLFSHATSHFFFLYQYFFHLSLFLSMCFCVSITTQSHTLSHPNSQFVFLVFLEQHFFLLLSFSLTLSFFLSMCFCVSTTTQSHTLSHPNSQFVFLVFLEQQLSFLLSFLTLTLSNPHDDHVHLFLHTFISLQLTFIQCGQMARLFFK